MRKVFYPHFTDEETKSEKLQWAHCYGPYSTQGSSFLWGVHPVQFGFGFYSLPLGKGKNMWPRPDQSEHPILFGFGD